jgi:hypothetical protein
MSTQTPVAPREERGDQGDEPATPTPACPIAEQCSETTFRVITAKCVSATFEPCGNPGCFRDDEPADDELVVVARGSGSKSMHRRQDGVDA